MVHFLENVKLPNNIISFMCTAAQQLNFLEMSHAWVMPKGTNWEYTEGRDNLPILLIWKVSEFCWKGSGTLFAITKSLDTWNWGLTLSVLHSSSGKLLPMLIIWIFCRHFGVEGVPDPYCISQDKLILMITHSQFMTKIQVGHGDKSWANLGRLRIDQDCTRWLTFDQYFTIGDLDLD